MSGTQRTVNGGFFPCHTQIAAVQFHGTDVSDSTVDVEQGMVRSVLEKFICRGGIPSGKTGLPFAVGFCKMLVLR